MDKKNERELLPDILRGFAIILVVFGHCIQDGSGEDYRNEALYFSDRLYQFIYSFHMPLFMMISGYLSWGSIHKAKERKERIDLLKRRAASLLTPIFLWTAVDYIRILISNHINGEPQPEALIFVYFYNALNNLWFLWAVWWCFCIVYIMHYFFKDSVVIYTLGFLVLFLIPDGLGLGAYKYMMPYFITAYYWHNYTQNKKHILRQTPQIWMLVVTGIVFAGLFAWYDENSFIYLSGYKLIGKNVKVQLFIDLYRTVIGFVGSSFFILLWQYIIMMPDKTNKNKGEYINLILRILRYFGIHSMGIYILSGYLIVFMIQRLAFIDHPSYIVNIIETVVVLAVALPATMLFGKIPVLSKFIGKKE